MNAIHTKIYLHQPLHNIQFTQSQALKALLQNVLNISIPFPDSPCSCQFFPEKKILERIF